MKGLSAIVVILVVAGCDQLSPLTNHVLASMAGKSAANTASPQDVFCSARKHTTCTTSALSEVLRGKLMLTAEGTGGPVRLWVPSLAGPATLIATSSEWTAPKRGGDRTTKKSLDQWVKDEIDRMTRLVEPLRTQLTSKAQPIVESIAQIGHTGHGPRTLTVVSSGAEVSKRYGDFECKLAHPKLFAKRLIKGPWPKDSLAGLRIEFAFVTGESPQRTGCISTDKKTRAQADAFTQAATAAGAEAVYFIGAPTAPVSKSAHAAQEKVQ